MRNGRSSPRLTASGGIKVSGLDHMVHVGADMALYMSLALSLIALMAFIMSGGSEQAREI